MEIQNNGKKTEVRFEGNLLVPVGNNINFNFLWLGTLNSSDNKVYVIGFKSDKKEDFIPLMQADLTDLKAKEEKEHNDNISAQINWIEKMLAEVSDAVWVKTPDPLMLDAATKIVSEALRRQGKFINRNLTVENTIYTSGVAAMYEK